MHANRMKPASQHCNSNVYNTLSARIQHQAIPVYSLPTPPLTTLHHRHHHIERTRASLTTALHWSLRLKVTAVNARVPVQGVYKCCCRRPSMIFCHVEAPRAKLIESSLQSQHCKGFIIMVGRRTIKSTVAVS